MSLYFTPLSELVTRKVRELFPEQVWADAFKIVGFGDPDVDASGQARVQLAILKLSSGDLRQLAEMAQAAAADFRDVLAWAEYPNALRHPDLTKLDDGTLRDIEQKDREQYLAWLNGPCDDERRA